MDVEKLICSGKATVVMEPLNRGGDDYAVILKINGNYFGEFPTYSDAAAHVEILANGGM